MTPIARILARLAVVLLVALVLTAKASAAIYRDVPDGSAQQVAVEGLTLAKVVNGYPDGNFYPVKAINRAELLKLLFKAAGKEPDMSQRLCFTDLEPGAWYEPYVCTAFAEGLVRGYPDGTFQPGREVNRAEGLQLIVAVFRLPRPSTVDAAVLKAAYGDILPDDWFALAVQVAVQRQILPVGGIESPTFAGGTALLRGQAAELMWNAIGSLQRSPLPSSSSSSSEIVNTETSSSSAASESSSSSSSSVGSRGSSSRSSSSSSSKASKPASTTQAVTLPFTQSISLQSKQSAIFTFAMGKTTTVGLSLDIDRNSASATCTLFKLGENGISNEYYFATVRDGGCDFRVTLGSGNYQLEVRAAAGAVTGKVAGETAKSDGNDGFKEAVLIKVGGVSARGLLSGTDNGQYYRFTLADKQTLTLELTSATGSPRCLIFPGDDVDLASFSGPQCNEAYEYSAGSYYVWIGHDPAAVTEQVFSLTLH